jgi:hypothetical protein
VINYAWANPTTGIREQAGTQAEARQRVWKEIQAYPAEAPSQFDDFMVAVYEQEAVGWASNEKHEVILSVPWDSYAFTDPSTGKRCIVGSFDMARIRIAEAWPEHAPVDSVTIYRQRLAFEVRWDDPEPEAPAPPEAEEETPSSLIAQVLAGNCADFGRAQLLASLWIAKSMQEVAGALHYMSPGPPRKKTGLWAIIKEIWGIWTAPVPHGQPNCQQCGQMLADPDGTICPKCARAILEKMIPPESSPGIVYQGSPHVYEFGEPGEGCGKCGWPEKHAIHGYTGD